MTYEAVFLNTFLKQFRKLPEGTRGRVKLRIHALIENPFLGVRLRGNLDGFWKDRVGDYRIIYKVEENVKRIVFYDVGPRKKIYDQI